MKLPLTEKSSLLIGGKFDPERERLRERAREVGVEFGADGLCPECDAGLTEADIENQACTQCGCVLVEPDDGDDSEEG